jgi:ketosteroid isomerase-like protein
MLAAFDWRKGSRSDTPAEEQGGWKLAAFANSLATAAAAGAMMKNWIFGGLGLLAVACAPMQSPSPTAAPAAADLPSRSETESYIRRSAAQWAASDVAAMAVFLADDYVGVASNGEIRNRARQLALAAEPSSHAITRIDYVRFHHHGPVVIAQGAETLAPADGGADRKLVWTDTWLFRDGHWQVVASQDSVRPAEGGDEERAAILALRTEHNRAIAVGDTEGFLRIAADDHAAIFGGGRIIRSKDELRRIWTANPQRCTRIPRRVEIGTVDGLRAAETGEWRCDDRDPARVYSGSYFAHWSKQSGAWRVVSDTYVTLGCRGEGCRDGH